ncbi:MAG: hypothetical protein ABF318_04995, partial [Ketobacter sp.]
MEQTLRQNVLPPALPLQWRCSQQCAATMTVSYPTMPRLFLSQTRQTTGKARVMPRFSVTNGTGIRIANCSWYKHTGGDHHGIGPFQTEQK